MFKNIQATTAAAAQVAKVTHFPLFTAAAGPSFLL